MKWIKAFGGANMLDLKNIKAMVFVLLIVAGCSSVKAPWRSVPRRPQLEYEAYGGWIHLNQIVGEKTFEFEGELISIQPDTIYFLTSAGDITSLANNDVTTARLILFKTDEGTFALWASIGALSTVSHGYGLVYSLPMWLLVGRGTTSGEVKRLNYLDYPKNSFNDFKPYSRFPQGLPVGLDLEQLKKRPIKK